MKRTAAALVFTLLASLAFSALAAGGIARRPLAAPQLTGHIFTTFAPRHELWAFGTNGNRQLGPAVAATTPNSNSAIAMGLDGYLRSMAAGDKHVIIALDDGSVEVWGAMDFYTGASPATANPDRRTLNYALFRNVRQVAAGNNASYVLLDNGDLYSFGYNSSGQLGQGTINSGSATPAKIGLSGVTYVDSKCDSAAAIDNQGRLFVWGSNGNGQLATGSAGGANGAPTQVGSNVIDVAVGCSFMLAMTADGTVWAWGSNFLGELGQGNTIPRYTPVIVSGLANAVSIAAGYYHGLAVMADGTVRGWGYNAYGQLGLGHSSTPVLSPQAPSGITTAIYAAAGDHHSVLGLQNKQDDVEIWTAGDNSNGQLGASATIPTARTTFATAATISFNAPAIRRTGLTRAFASDLFWYNPTTGQTGYWAGATAPTNVFKALPTIPAGYTVFGTADINFDDLTEIFFYHPGTGDVYFWSTVDPFGSNNAVVVEEAKIGSVPPASAWRPQAAGDFDGDGVADILWRNTSTGDVAVWSLDSVGRTTSNLGLGAVGLAWTIVKTGDFDGDGLDDILWRNTSSGEVYIWRGTKVRGLFRQTFAGSAGLAWVPQAVVDLDGDGRSDIFWRNTSTGENFIWYMQGGGYVGAFTRTVGDLNWNVIATFMLNANDPQSSIVWRNATTGEVYYWAYGDRPAGGTATPSQEGSLGPASLSWLIGQ